MLSPRQITRRTKLIFFSMRRTLAFFWNFLHANLSSLLTYKIFKWNSYCRQNGLCVMCIHRWEKNTCFFRTKIESKIFSSLSTQNSMWSKEVKKKKKKKVTTTQRMSRQIKIVYWKRTILFNGYVMVFYIHFVVCVYVFAPWNFWPFVFDWIYNSRELCSIYLVKISICHPLESILEFVIVPIFSIQQCSSFFFLYFHILRCMNI